jgi:hypothetical protein
LKVIKMMKWFVTAMAIGLGASLVHAAEKTLTLPIDSASAGIVTDTNKDGKFDQVKDGEKNAVEWRVGRYFDGPVVTVMEVAIPQELQGKTVKVISAELELSINGANGTYPDKQPELAPDTLIYLYTGKQADGKVTVDDVLDADGKPLGEEAGYLIENQTPVKAGTRIKADITQACQKAFDAQAPVIGLRLQAKTTPDVVAAWRWRGTTFATKYGKNYMPVLKLKVSVE